MALLQQRISPTSINTKTQSSPSHHGLRSSRKIRHHHQQKKPWMLFLSALLVGGVFYQVSQRPLKVPDAQEVLVATTSPEDPRLANMPVGMQISKRQASKIVSMLPSDGNGNLLVWGLGNDSPFWHNLTTGKVVFVEDDYPAEKDGKLWYNYVMDQFPFLNSFQVHYTTKLEDSWNIHHEHVENWPALDLTDLPPTVRNTKWDVILVDAPLGCCGMGPGRYQSIFVTAQLVRQQLMADPDSTVHVVVDDFERKVERHFSQEVYGKPPHAVVTRGKTAHAAANQQAYYSFTSADCMIQGTCGAGLVPLNTTDLSTFTLTIPEVKEEEPVTWSDKWIILLTVNSGFVDFFWNWLAHFETLVLQKADPAKIAFPFEHLLVLAEDDESYEILQEYATKSNANQLLKIKMIVDRTSLFVSESKLSYESKGYTALVSTRPTHILKQLLAGYNVLYSDTDTVWRSDPRPYLNASDEQVDMALAVDNVSYDGMSPYYCTGFMAVKTNERTQAFMRLWEERLLKENQLNQPIFNRLLHKETEHSRHWALPLDEFPHGKLYFDENTTQREHAVVVHNNYIIGTDAKRGRFKDHSLWLDRSSLPH